MTNTNPNNFFNIIQWNINGFYKKIDDLNIIIQEHNPIAICLQETNLKYQQESSFKNFSLFKKNRTEQLRASGGVAILVNSSVPSEEITLHTNLEAIAVTITLETKITLCNIYLPNQTQFNTSDIENILKQIPSPFIFLGDFNSHNTIWGSYKTDKRGSIIENLLHMDSIILLNNGDHTRLNPINGHFSAIDLSFSSPALSQRTTWQVLPELYNSDHIPILIKIESQIAISDRKFNRWNLKNPIWNDFSSSLEKEVKKIKNLLSVNDINVIVSKFSDIIIQTAEQTIGRTSISSHRQKVPWWNQEIKKCIKDKNRALKKFQNTKTTTDHIQLKKLRAKTRYLVKRSKTASWTNFTTNLGSQIDSHLMWNKIRSLQGNKKPTNIYLSDGTNLTTDPKIVANDLAKYFEENTSNNNYNPEFLKNNQSITPPVSSINTNAEHQIYLNSPITLNEYYNALKSCKSKSPGPDDIPFIFIHNFPLNATLYLLEIFNLIWKNNSLPSSWRHSIIIPISKPGKNKFKPEGYRPISLLNTMGKLLEKIINHRLTWYLEKINFLSAH